MMPKKETPLSIFQEGRAYYVGKKGYFSRSRTGYGEKGLKNALKMIGIKIN